MKSHEKTTKGLSDIPHVIIHGMFIVNYCKTYNNFIWCYIN